METLSKRQIMNRIYKDISGFKIPKNDEQIVRKSKGSPVYGEINHQSMNKLLSSLKVGPKDVLFDLGSGVGKVVLYAALFTKIKKAVGIELSKTRHQEALLALDNAKLWANDIRSRCQLVNANLMDVDLSSATIIYTCSTAFSLSFMKDIVKRLALLKQPFRLVSLQDLPDDKHFHLVDKLNLDMSWIRNTPVYIYERRQ